MPSWNSSWIQSCWFVCCVRWYHRSELISSVWKRQPLPPAMYRVHPGNDRCSASPVSHWCFAPFRWGKSCSQTARVANGSKDALSAPNTASGVYALVTTAVSRVLVQQPALLAWLLGSLSWSSAGGSMSGPRCDIYFMFLNEEAAEENSLEGACVYERVLGWLPSLIPLNSSKWEMSNPAAVSLTMCATMPPPWGDLWCFRTWTKQHHLCRTSPRIIGLPFSLSSSSSNHFTPPLLGTSPLLWATQEFTRNQTSTFWMCRWNERLCPGGGVNAYTSMQAQTEQCPTRKPDSGWMYILWLEKKQTLISTMPATDSCRGNIVTDGFGTVVHKGEGKAAPETCSHRTDLTPVFLHGWW